MTRSLSNFVAARTIGARGARALLLTFAGLAAILGSSLVAIGQQASAAKSPVKIANFTFDPGTVTVKAGTTVTWVNNDDIPHMVVAADGKFRSSALDTDDKFSRTFSMPGTYLYFCGLHPRMTGKIVVTP